MKTKAHPKTNARLLQPRGNSRPTVAQRSFRQVGPQIRTIVVPIDFSTPSAQALKYAAALARQFGAKIILLNVVEPVATPDFAYYPLMMENDKILAGVKKELERLPAAQHVEASLIEKVVVRNGVAFQQITDTADLLKADLIVISTHGYTGLKHMLLGSTTERVVRHARCPVLVVRGQPASKGKS